MVVAAAVRVAAEASQAGATMASAEDTFRRTVPVPLRFRRGQPHGAILASQDIQMPLRAILTSQDIQMPPTSITTMGGSGTIRVVAIPTFIPIILGSTDVLEAASVGAMCFISRAGPGNVS